MHTPPLPVAALCAALLTTSCVSTGTRTHGPGNSPAQVTGNAYRLEPAYLVTVHVPNADVDKILAAVVAAVGLHYGKYDKVAYLDAPGIEQFRPLAGSKAGKQSDTSRVPSTIVRFSVPRDTTILKKALDAIYTAHPYEEPVIYVRAVWRTRSTKPDNANPNRWWNHESQ